MKVALKQTDTPVYKFIRLTTRMTCLSKEHINGLLQRYSKAHTWFVSTEKRCRPPRGFGKSSLTVFQPRNLCRGNTVDAHWERKAQVKPLYIPAVASVISDNLFEAISKVTHKNNGVIGTLQKLAIADAEDSSIDADILYTEKSRKCRTIMTQKHNTHFETHRRSAPWHNS